jgi:hypothetical protein
MNWQIQFSETAGTERKVEAAAASLDSAGKGQRIALRLNY